jgi:hypothetical protein
MADEEEPVPAQQGTTEIARHVDDYTSFIKLLKWGAIACLVIGLVWMLIVKAYW